MRTTQPRVREETPWGAVQSVKTLISGVARIYTAGHGGYWCSPGRWYEVMQRFPGMNPWAGPGWLEEDCDWAFAALTWPTQFTDRDIHYAIASVTRAGGSNDGVAATFLMTQEGLALDRRARAYREKEVAVENHPS